MKHKYINTHGNHPVPDQVARCCKVDCGGMRSTHGSLTDESSSRDFVVLIQTPLRVVDTLSACRHMRARLSRHRDMETLTPNVRGWNNGIVTERDGRYKNRQSIPLTRIISAVSLPVQIFCSGHVSLILLSVTRSLLFSIVVFVSTSYTRFACVSTTLYPNNPAPQHTKYPPPPESSSHE